jgi:hypothetical protein
VSEQLEPPQGYPSRALEGGAPGSRRHLTLTSFLAKTFESVSNTHTHRTAAASADCAQVAKRSAPGRALRATTMHCLYLQVCVSSKGPHDTLGGSGKDKVVEGTCPAGQEPLFPPSVVNTSRYLL